MTRWQQVDDWTARNLHSVDNWDGRAYGPRGTNQSNHHFAHPTNRYNNINNSSSHNPSGTLGPRGGEFYKVANPMAQGYGERNFESNKISEARGTFPSGQTLPHNGGISQRSTPFTKSFSPSRYYLFDSLFRQSDVRKF